MNFQYQLLFGSDEAAYLGGLLLKRIISKSSENIEASGIAQAMSLLTGHEREYLSNYKLKRFSLGEVSMR